MDFLQICNRAAGLLVIGILIVAATLLYRWSQSPHEEPVVRIEAAYDVLDQTIPVFAQFIVTQKLYLYEPSLITKLTIPIYAPFESRSLDVSLLHRGTLIAHWNYQPEQSNTVVTATLPLDFPLMLDGPLKVVFNGSHIPHEDKEKAPRIFYESAQNSYREGGYLIAANEKRGNISLTMSEIVTNGDLFSQKLRNAPLVAISQMIWGGIILFLLCMLPYRIISYLRH